MVGINFSWHLITFDSKYFIGLDGFRYVFDCFVSQAPKAENFSNCLLDTSQYMVMKMMRSQKMCLSPISVSAMRVCWWKRNGAWLEIESAKNWISDNEIDFLCERMDSFVGTCFFLQKFIPVSLHSFRHTTYSLMIFSVYWNCEDEKRFDFVIYSWSCNF